MWIAFLKNNTSMALINLFNNFTDNKPTIYA
jgi:hypothetical protein